jgi:uncharacterized protein (DUF427 family)
VHKCCKKEGALRRILFLRLESSGFTSQITQCVASDIVVDEGVLGELMAKAVWNGKVLAESEKTQLVEGNVYFPHESIDREFFRSSSTISTCPWKGQARYYTILVDGQENSDAAWYYPDPKPAARAIKNHVAFWRGVEIEK